MQQANTGFFQPAAQRKNNSFRKEEDQRVSSAVRLQGAEVGGRGVAGLGGVESDFPGGTLHLLDAQSALV
jgi:hypothetical protein